MKAPEQIAKEIYELFSAKPESQFIAKEHAIMGLINHIINKKPRNILEVGAGIGTLTFTICKAIELINAGDSGNYRPKITTLEPNEICVEQLTNNLFDFKENFTLIQSFEFDSYSFEPFDLIVIDGGNLRPEYYTKVAKNGAVFVEGFMNKTRDILKKTNKDRKLAYTNFRSNDRAHGYWLYFFEPSINDVFKIELENLKNKFFSLRKKIFNKKRPAPVEQ